MESACLSSLRLLLYPQTKIDHRPENAPPVDDRPHFRISELGTRIDLRHRHFTVPVAEPDGFQHQVRLELVAVEPFLAPVDALIEQEAGLERAESVRALGHALAGGDREDERVDDA